MAETRDTAQVFVRSFGVQGSDVPPWMIEEWDKIDERIAELEAEEAFDRSFRFIRIEAWRKMAAEGVQGAAEELRLELADYRMQLVEDLRMDPGEMPKSRESYRPVGSYLRKLIFKRDGHKCQLCGKTDGFFELDHKHPFSRGGRHSYENLWVLCKTCNRDKGTMTVEEYLEHRAGLDDAEVLC